MIYSKLDDIPLELIESEIEFDEKLYSIFNDSLLPKFLKELYL